MSFRLSMPLLLWLLFIVAGLPACGGSTPKAVVQSQVPMDLSALEGKSSLYPVVIIGSGPAGLSSAVYAGRGKAKTVVLLGYKPGGLLTETSYVENWPGIESTLGKDIMEKMNKQARTFGAELWEEGAEKVDLTSWPYKITTTEDKEIYAMTIIMATGANPRLLDIPGEKEYWGKGVTTCAVCDAPFYKDKEVVVIGGGDSAVEEAIQLAQYAKKITILVRKESMRAAPTMQELLKGYPHISVTYNVEPKEIKGNGDQVTAIALSNAQTQEATDMPTDGVFLAIGHIPNSKLVKGKIDLDEQGYIKLVGRTQKTSLQGVYAAGDVEDHQYRQAGVAAGHGIAAALDALALLNEIGFNTEIAQKMGLALPAHSMQQIATVAELEEVIARVPLAVVACGTDDTESISIDGALRDRNVAILKVNIDKCRDIAKKYYVLEAPVVLVFKEGTLVGRFNQSLKTPELSALLVSLADEKSSSLLHA